MNRLTAYLYFGGNCREAMEFYQACLGGKLNIMTVGQSPMGAQFPDKKNMIMHADLETPELAIMASDNITGGSKVTGDRISLCINGDDAEQLKTFFSNLSQGGKITTPLKQEFFGLYGALTDKFGLNWMFQSMGKK
jgi:PhnB protein